MQDIRGFYALIFVAADNLLSLIHVSHKIKQAQESLAAAMSLSGMITS